MDDPDKFIKKPKQSKLTLFFRREGASRGEEPALNEVQPRSSHSTTEEDNGEGAEDNSNLPPGSEPDSPEHGCDPTDPELHSSRIQLDLNSDPKAPDPQEPESSLVEAVPGPSSSCADKLSRFQAPVDISPSKEMPPVQPYLRNFPKTQFVNQNRAFSSLWYSKYPLLEYSVAKDNVYCFCCRHFTTTVTDSMPWVTGYGDWKHLADHVAKHFLSKPHEFCLQKYSGYLESKEKGAVNTRVPGTSKKDVLRNRAVITAHIQVILLCAQQDLALRGHRVDDAADTNPGNFLEILKLLKAREPELMQASEELPSNAKYTHNLIQNEIINICGGMVREMITSEVKEDVNCFSLIADETRDAGGTEQLSVCLRYLHQHKIKERFMGFVDLHSFDAGSITAAIIQLVCDAGLDIRNCVAQSYDGASVMSGKQSGVQMRVESIIGGSCPYIHCYAHRLNLVLVDCCNGIPQVKMLLGLLQAIYNFQSNSTLRKEYFEKAQMDLQFSEVLKLPKSVDTRWFSRKRGIDYFCKRLDAVIYALEDIVETGKKEEAAECTGYIQQLMDFNNIFTLALMEELLGRTNPLSEYLQCSDLKYTRALALCESTIRQLTAARNDNDFQRIWKAAALLAERVSATVPDQSSVCNLSRKRKRVPSSRLKSYVVLSTTGNNEENEFETFGGKFRAAYYEVIDRFISELQRRMSNNSSLLNGVVSSDPTHALFLDPDTVLSFCQSYARFDFNIRNMQSQLQVGRDLLLAEKLVTAESCHEYLSKMKDSFPDLYMYFSLILCIPVSSSTCERSFSSLNRIKSNIRTTMAEDRLSSLALLSIERDLSNRLQENPSIVVDEFAKLPNRRLVFTLYLLKS